MTNNQEIHEIHDRTLQPEDAEAIQETCATPGHHLIENRLRETIKREQSALEMPSDEMTTNIRRGKIAGLRIALDLPQILEDEAKEKHGRPETRSQRTS